MKQSELILTEQVKHSLETGERIEGLGTSNGFWYDLSRGGYVKIEDIISDPAQIQKIKEAVETLEALENVYEQVIEEF